ncbi:MAG: hypothetical protein RR255_00470 [Bacilli bacterium]
MEIKLKDNKKIDFFELEKGTVFLYRKIDAEVNTNIGMKVRNSLTNTPTILNIRTGNLILPFTSFSIESYEIIRIIDCELVEK